MKNMKKATKRRSDAATKGKTPAQVVHELQVHLMVLEKEAKVLCEVVERTKQKLIEIITSQYEAKRNQGIEGSRDQDGGSDHQITTSPNRHILRGFRRGLPLAH